MQYTPKEILRRPQQHKPRPQPTSQAEEKKREQEEQIDQLRYAAQQAA